MFKNEGLYYCLNACSKYPISMTCIKDFLCNLSANSVENVYCYNVSSNSFSYDNIMNSLYDIVEGDISLLDEMVLERLDFCYCGCDFQLQVELFDKEFYGITLIHNIEDNLSDENLMEMRRLFYNAIKPIYGNDGIEKSLYSINFLDEDDVDLFSKNVYLGNDVAKNVVSKITNHFEELEDGLFYFKIDEKYYYKLLKSFYSYRVKQ